MGLIDSPIMKASILTWSQYVKSQERDKFQMSPNERIVTYPIMGRDNTRVIKTNLESLGLNVLPPPPTTDGTIKMGVKNSSDMMCFPYKVTLGNFKEAIDSGANTLLIFDSAGRCRFRQYNKLHDFTLRDMGHDFEMHNLSLGNIVAKLSLLSGKGLGECYDVFKNYIHETREADKGFQQWSEDRPNIGIIGEIFCACDEKINHSLEDNISKYGGNPYNTARVSDFLSMLMKKKLGIFQSGFCDTLLGDPMGEYKKEAKTYFNGDLGGHAFENIYNLLALRDRGVDGMVHILPLSCMPESTIEPYVDGICKDSKIPLLRIPIDETNSPANLETRLETFVELIKLRKMKSSGVRL